MNVVLVVAIVALLLIANWLLWFLLDQRMTALESQISALEQQLKVLSKGDIS